MGFQSVKCNITQITRKPIKKINASYTLEGTVLDNVEKIKYLGINITNKACPKDVKESANKGLVRPVLEYGSSD